MAEEKRIDEETPHRVTLTKGFHMGAHLVTQEQWEQVMGKEANRSRFMGQGDEKKKLPKPTPAGGGAPHRAHCLPGRRAGPDDRTDG